MSIVRLTIATVLSLSAIMFSVSAFNSIIRAGRCCKFSTNVKNSALSGIFKQRRGPRCRLGEKARKDENDTKDRPFTLPPGAFRPKQSLGQNFLSDQNYVLKICDAFQDKSDRGHKVVEIGPGPGALTRVLFQRYPDMTAIEIDQRAVAFLGEKLPGLKVQHLDVLKADWAQMAADRGGSLNIIANLPYYIVSQVLFSLADNHKAIDIAVVTMQLEVAERIVAKPSTKQYGIPSVVFQLYGAPKINFKIPPSVFYPKPNVDSALLTLDFTKPHSELHRIDGDHLRKILTRVFQQRRKMMRQSLKDLLNTEKAEMPEKWATKRPEELSPSDFIQLTIDIFGENLQPPRDSDVTKTISVESVTRCDTGSITGDVKEKFESRQVWRKALFGASGSPTYGKSKEAEEEVEE